MSSLDAKPSVWTYFILPASVSHHSVCDNKPLFWLHERGAIQSCVTAGIFPLSSFIFLFRQERVGRKRKEKEGRFEKSQKEFLITEARKCGDTEYIDIK
jgi:hypothetical protein